MKELKQPTREAWLNAALDTLRPMFTEAGMGLPENLKVSCGWPVRGGMSTRKRVIGECWKAEASTEGATQIFISPWLAEPLEVLETLVHELIHAARPAAKHGPDFKDGMKKVGLIGKATSTKAGDELILRLAQLSETLGDYDNGKLGLATPADSPKKQSCRQRKIICPKNAAHENGTDVIYRASKKVADLGLPECPVCGEQLELEEQDETEDEDDN